MLTELREESRSDKRAIDPLDLVRDFDTYFDIVPAYTEALRDEVYRIRYQVYAEELGWENTVRFPADREQDEFDQHSLHCLLKHRQSDEFIGCVRLVRANMGDPGAMLPAEQAYGRKFTLEGFRSETDDRRLIGEISRIAVISKFRHRPGEQNIPETSIQDSEPIHPKGRRRFPHIALGLYLAAAAIGVSQGLNVVVAMMEPKLARRLRIFGITFEQVADPIEHHGLRAAYRLTHESFEEGLSPPIRALFEFIYAKVDHRD